jgi:hypothetical protein
MITSWHFISKRCVCVIWTTASATFIRTWFVITMFKLWCILCRKLLCNLWWWPLNLVWSWLLCEMVWNSSRFHGLPSYTGLSLLNCPPVGWFSYLISYNWAVLLQLSHGSSKAQGRQLVYHKISSPPESHHYHINLLSIWDFYPSNENKQV